MNNRLRDIPRSRAFTTGFKLFTGLTFFAMAGAFVTGVSTCQPKFRSSHYPPIQCTGPQGLVGSILGPITAGWKGGVGNHLAYAVFLALAGGAFFLAGLLTAFRDADPKSVAEAAHAETVPVLNPPSTLSYWPALTAVSVAVIAIGLVSNTALFVAGCVALAVSVLMWVITNWSEKATGDPEVNAQLRERLAIGIEVPLAAAVVVGLVAISLSRVLLTVGRLEAVAVAGVVAGVAFLAGVLIAYVRQIDKNVIAVLVITGVILIVGAGLVSAAQGERTFEHHSTGQPAGSSSGTGGN
jgi:hypothetical protein